ncbi:MAG: 6-phosphofructokinase [Candidatus Omnitrophica bacterium]|nr:6-phosphofructokinase [Candidatus Omnitrophota bacterium]
MKRKMRVAILTGGGDCPGLNAVIRAATKKIINDQGAEVIGFKDGYEGLINNRYRRLNYKDVSGILTLGGTILGTSNIANPYRYATKVGKRLEFRDVSKKALRNIKRLKVDCLICIGGDGTLHIASKLYRDAVPVVGVPKTIDNDIRGTDTTFGFDTAVYIATEGIDRIHTTAQSHHRIMIVEVMGRTAGWIALYSGLAGGGDIILIPEIPYDIEKVARVVKGRNKKGKKFSIIVIAEGAREKGRDVVVKRIIKESTIQARLGGVGFALEERLEEITGLATRTVVMGHLLRGGTPTPFDRILATQLGTKAAEFFEQKKFGCMVGIRGGKFVPVPLREVAKGPRVIPLNHTLIKAGRSINTCFGD